MALVFCSVPTHCIRDLADRQYPRATKIRPVQDNLNTHNGASLYESFRPEDASRIFAKIEFHYTPKHGSWLNMAETEINIMDHQCLDRRLDNRNLMTKDVAAWENARIATKARIHWRFTLAAAWQKLRKFYPSIED
jgi:Tfp pilus assembly protein PilF